MGAHAEDENLAAPPEQAIGSRAQIFLGGFMDLSGRVLGSHAIDYVKETQTGVVLRIGGDGFTRSVLSRVSCFNFAAAANLSRQLNEHLKVRDTSWVFYHVHPRELALPRLGAVGLAVLGAAFEAKGLGGDKPLLAW